LYYCVAAYDLATQCPSRRATLRRRHTVVGTKDDKNENEINDELVRNFRIYNKDTIYSAEKIK